MVIQIRLTLSAFGLAAVRFRPELALDGGPMHALYAILRVAAARAPLPDLDRYDIVSA